MLTRTNNPSFDSNAQPTADIGWLDGFARKLLLSKLQGIRGGRLILTDGSARQHLGTGPTPGDAATPPIHVRVIRPRFYRRVCLGGTVAAGEAFADGDWECSDLTGLIALFAANRDHLDSIDGGLRRARALLDKMHHAANRNTLTGSARNIAAHYDLSNEFFSTFLDERMMYSSAIFPKDRARRDVTLDEASETKLATLCDKLALTADDHVLEIGSGWGGFAIYAASRFGCRVTTTTISPAQYTEARRRVTAAGLDERVTVLLEDYRSLSGRFEKIVSVEMVEAVGNDFVDLYFRVCDRLLEPGGVFVMQAITIEDQNFDAAVADVDFIKKHIFPGSFIPSVTRLVTASRHTQALRLVHLEDIGPDYAETLARWRKRFTEASDELAELGFDARFQRLWQFYFQYCEGGFRAGAISDVQMVFKKRDGLSVDANTTQAVST